MPDHFSEINRLLGQLESKSQQVVDSTKTLFGKIDVLDSDIEETAQTVALIDQRLSQVEHALAKHVLPTIKNFESLRDRGWGVLTILAIICGAVVNLLTKFFERLLP